MKPDEQKSGEFVEKLRHAINSCSMENGSNTPDFLLADYLLRCLDNYDRTVRLREKWYGREKATTTHIQDEPENDNAR